MKFDVVTIFPRIVETTRFVAFELVYLIYRRDSPVAKKSHRVRVGLFVNIASELKSRTLSSKYFKQGSRDEVAGFEITPVLRPNYQTP